MTTTQPVDVAEFSKCRMLVVGGGSMGKRRIRSLLAQGIQKSQIGLCDLQDERRKQVGAEFGIETHSGLPTALRLSPHAVFVCVPGAYHLDVCISAARAHAHIFCEVPLSLTLDRVDELRNLTEANRILYVPGCQQVFHPLYRQLKNWLQSPQFGKPCFHSQAWGLYLPAWHPYEDYRKFYASDPKQGGGNLDVLAHEITVAAWLTGQRITKVHCLATHCSSLEIKGPDYMQMSAITDRGMAVNLEFDLIQRAYRNEMRFVSEQETVVLQLDADVAARRYSAESREWETFRAPSEYAYEQCYIDEVGHFLACLQGKADWPISFDDALYAVKFLLAVSQSIASGKSELV